LGGSNRFVSTIVVGRRIRRIRHHSLAVIRRDPLTNPEPLIRRVYAYVAYRIGDGPDAEDVTSATFERALRYRSSFDPRRGGPLSWLLGIARREIRTYLSQRQVYPMSEIEAAAPDDGADDAASRLDLIVALRSLDDGERELIALRFGADLTARQIGEVLDRKTNAVEVALHRALRKLRQELEPVPGPGGMAIPEATPAP
jgi:RNA polymerase sigma factor (sigma-70 family)